MKNIMPAKAPGYPGAADPGCGCRFPLWGHAERYRHGESLFCGAPRSADTRTVYCAFHDAVAEGDGTPSERSAINDARYIAKRG